MYQRYIGALCVLNIIYLELLHIFLVGYDSLEINMDRLVMGRVLYDLLCCSIFLTVIISLRSVFSISRIPIRGPLNIDIREFLSLVSYRRVDSVFLVF